MINYSPGHALSPPPLPSHFRPQRGALLHSKFLRSSSETTRRAFGTRITADGAYGELELPGAGTLTYTKQVLCSVVKWCWSRLPGGVVGWEAYELFKVGETGRNFRRCSYVKDANIHADSNLARDSFATFIPISVESEARTKIIFDFFDLLSAIAAHAKSNGLGGRKLSRLAGWWAFEHNDSGNGFDGGYKAWAS